jgi:hypothetical protein
MSDRELEQRISVQTVQRIAGLHVETGSTLWLLLLCKKKDDE